MRILSVTITAAAFWAVSALPAEALICRHQPGQGAIDQYCEIIPSGAGERPDRTGGDTTGSLPAKAARTLAQAGAAGRGVAALAQTSPAPQLSATSPSAGGSADAAADQSSRLGGGSQPEATTSGTLSAVVGDLDGPGGRGWLPWALVGVAVAAGLAAWLRRGRSS
jgi:hypothetical protein